MADQLSDTAAYEVASDSGGAQRDRDELMNGLISSLQAENERLRYDLLEQQRSGGELKILLKSTLSESEVGRELNRVLAEQERLLKRVDVFKVEKAHLVDSILELSTEVDELQSAKVEELARYQQDSVRLLYSEKSVMGTTIIDHLKARDVDTQLVREVTSIISTCLATSHKSSAHDGARSIGGVNISMFAQKGNISDVPSPSNRSRKSPRSGKKGFRRKDYLDRDENDSVISSVSTHRQRPLPQNYRGQTSNITEAALARLDRLHDCEPDDKDGPVIDSFLPKDVVNFFSGLFS